MSSSSCGVTGESAEPAPHGGPGAPEVRVLRRFRLVFNAIKSHFQQVEKKAGVGGAQLWALSVIQAQPGIGVNGLAAAMDIHQTTASNLVRSLAAEGMVSASRSATDRRTVQLQLLPAGQAVLSKAPGPFAGVLPEALASLDSETLERLDRDLARLIAVLKPDERAAGVPLAHM
jgi:DNA-binding MarR family transcriptional regulator